MNTIQADRRKMSALIAAHPELAKEIEGALVSPGRLANCDRVFVTGFQLVPEGELSPLRPIGTEETLAEGPRVPARHHNKTVRWRGPIVPEEVVQHFRDHPLKDGFCDMEAMQMGLGDFVYSRPLSHYSEGRVVEKQNLVKAFGSALSHDFLHPFRELSRPDYCSLWRREINVTPQMVKLLKESVELQGYLKRLGTLSQVVDREQLLPDWERTGFDGHACCQVAIPGQSDFTFILRAAYEEDGFKLILKDRLNKGGTTGDGELVIGKICCRGVL